jgi:hypothetical protein
MQVCSLAAALVQEPVRMGSLSTYTYYSSKE